MLRVKIPQGILDAAQLEALADVAERWSRGFGHVTTRQNVQFHFMKLHDVELALRRLAEAGLTSREACGNSVRNVTACPYAGVARDEVFDVTPYAEALTRYFLGHRLSSSLPRKFKIAFEGCEDDHVYAAINDIGWRARVLETDGERKRGFRVTAGGGSSILPTSGRVLFDFLPAGEILDVAEAILRTFHRLGDYQHRRRNRMKFLIRPGLGELEGGGAGLAEVRAEGGARLPRSRECAGRGGTSRPTALAQDAGRGGGEGGGRRAHRTGPASGDPAGPAGPRRGRCPVVAHERAPAEAGGLLDRDRDRAPRRPHRRADAPAG
jgi:sulfite reductase (NADPH) hemoprotein beta-component